VENDRCRTIRLEGRYGDARGSLFRIGTYKSVHNNQDMPMPAYERTGLLQSPIAVDYVTISLLSLFIYYNLYLLLILIILIMTTTDSTEDQVRNGKQGQFPRPC
jgi:hypothetical protein